MKEVFEFLKSCGTYYIATAEGDQPRVRPFGTIDLYEGRIYFQTGLKKEIARQLLANPKLELSGMHEGRWIRVAAEAVLDERIEPQEHMLENYPELRAMYTPGDGNTAVFWLKNAVAQICSFTEPPKEIRF